MFINTRFLLLFLMALFAQMCQESVARRCSIKTRHQQCKDAYPRARGYCDPSSVNMNMSQICVALYCAFAYRGATYALHYIIPDDGTPCGDNSVCDEGRCWSIENETETPEYEGVEREGYSCLRRRVYEDVVRRYNEVG